MSHPTDPTQPPGPTPPGDPDRPTDPTTPAEPADPIGPTDPTAPDPADPAEPAAASEPEPATAAVPDPAPDPAGETEPGGTAGTAGQTEPVAEAETEATAEPDATEPDATEPGRRGRVSATRVLTMVLLALLGFSIVVQVRNVSTDPELAALGQEDLVRILANLDAHEDRLREEIGDLEESKRRLTTAGRSQEEAQAEAERRADELGILAGTLPAEGPGLVVEFGGPPAAVSAARLLDAVQELRGAGAEAMQLRDGQGNQVRVVASTYFLDAEAGVVVDGATLHSPYTLTAIGDPQTLAPALNLPGGVVETVHREGGTVTVQEEPGGVEVTVLRAPDDLQHARPAS